MYQLAYSRVLSWTANVIAGSLLEEEGDEKFKVSLELAAWLLSLLRLVNVSGIISSSLGLIGLQRDSLPLIRLFTLHTAFDIALSVLLTLIVALITLTSSSTSTTSFCDLLANSDILTDLVGTGGIESCEERWRSVVGTFVVGALLVAGARIWGLIKCNKELSRRQRRRGPSLSINTAAAAAGRNGERYYTDHPGSTTTANSKRPRIFLLPTPHSSSTVTPKGTDRSIPLLSLTPSSPADTFPPLHHQQISPPAPAPVEEDTSTTPTATRSSEQSYIVYAPVRMTAEEARKLSASEVVFSSGHGGNRARSHSQLQSPLSALASGGGSESTTKLA